mgnify:CR=1 FL=1
MPAATSMSLMVVCHVLVMAKMSLMIFHTATHTRSPRCRCHRRHRPRLRSNTSSNGIGTPSPRRQKRRRRRRRWRWERRSGLAAARGAVAQLRVRDIATPRVSSPAAPSACGSCGTRRGTGLVCVCGGGGKRGQVGELAWRATGVAICGSSDGRAAPGGHYSFFFRALAQPLKWKGCALCVDQQHMLGMHMTPP